jgi:HEPN domain-containing protein
VPPPNPIPGTAQDWLTRARAKLALALIPLPAGGRLEDLCYMAQQAAELAIKAVYMQHGWLFPYIHTLGKLLDGLIAQGLTIPTDVQDADQLTRYAVETRYPGLVAPVAQNEYDEAVRIAQAVLAWAESLVSA